MDVNAFSSFLSLPSKLTAVFDLRLDHKNNGCPQNLFVAKIFMESEAVDTSVCLADPTDFLERIKDQLVIPDLIFSLFTLLSQGILPLSFSDAVPGLYSSKIVMSKCE